MRYIDFSKRISGSAVEDLLVELRSTDINCVYVNSPGGRFNFFSALAPAIERRGLVTLSGNVRSAAVILFLLGHQRYALPDAQFFFHEVRTFVDDTREVTLCEMEEILEYQEWLSGEDQEVFQEWLRQMRAAQSWFLHFMREKTGLSASTFLDLMRNEATLSAREAVRYGVVHQVVSADWLRD